MTEHTGPSEEQVRAWLESCERELLRLSAVCPDSQATQYAQCATAALALLDAGRKDRERLDWMDEQSAGVTVEDNECGSCRVQSNTDYLLVGDSPSGYNLRAAIDTARGA